MRLQERADVAYILTKHFSGIDFEQPRLIDTPEEILRYEGIAIFPGSQMAYVASDNAIIARPESGDYFRVAFEGKGLSEDTMRGLLLFDSLYLLLHEHTHAAIAAVRSEPAAHWRNFPLFIRDEGLCESIAMKGMLSYGNIYMNGIVDFHERLHGVALAEASSYPPGTDMWKADMKMALMDPESALKIKIPLGWRFCRGLPALDVRSLACDSTISFWHILDPSTYRNV
jgi:hypothetical protein